MGYQLPQDDSNDPEPTITQAQELSLQIIKDIIEEAMNKGQEDTTMIPSLDINFNAQEDQEELEEPHTDLPSS